MREQETILIEQAQGGNVSAIGQLYDGHHEQIFRYVWSRVGHKQLAEDLTGEIFTRMVTHLPTYRLQQAPFRAWLYQIARHLIADHFRSGRGVAQISLQEVEMPADTIDTDTLIERKLSLKKVHAALTRIDDEQRDVILMRFILGFSLREVAETLNKSVSAIKAIQHRGLNNVRATLKVIE